MRFENNDKNFRAIKWSRLLVCPKKIPPTTRVSKTESVIILTTYESTYPAATFDYLKMNETNML